MGHCLNLEGDKFKFKKNLKLHLKSEPPKADVKRSWYEKNKKIS